MPEISTPITGCRSCGSDHLVTILSFGETPLADGLLTADQLDALPLTAALTLMFCPDCALVQIKENVDPEVLFGGDYPYFSSVSQALLKHFGDSAQAIMDQMQLDADSWVVEAASNDGYMLRNFVARGIPVLKLRSM